MSKSTERIDRVIKQLENNLHKESLVDGSFGIKDDLLLSVIIPARNEFPNIVHTYHSIMNCIEADGIDPREVEVIIVNNTSEPWNDPKYDWTKPGDRGTVEYLMPRGGYWSRNLRVMYDPIAGNHSARNKGAKIARGKYLFISDAHMSYRPGFFNLMIKTIDETGGLFHGSIAWMGAYPPHDGGVGTQYTIKLGEEIKGCVDKQTEILTMAGWKKHFEVNYETEFVTVNMKTKELEVQKPSALLIKRYKGEMIECKGRSYDALLTPNHRTIYKKSNGNVWKIKAAKDIKKRNLLPLGTNGLIKESTVFKDEFVEIIGWIITEGSFREDGSICIVQYKKDNNQRIRDLLQILGFSFFVKKRGDIVVNVNPSKEILKMLPKKELTFEFLNMLSRVQLEKLYGVMIDGDGWRSTTNESFIQLNRTTIDAFQYLCVLIGRASKWYVRTVASYKGKHFGKNDMNIVSVKKNKYTNGLRVNAREYDGVIWCPTVPNGTIFARRNGHVYPTGQTWANYRPWNGDWFYIFGLGHCSVGVRRSQFLAFGGYPDVHRTYGGGEFFVDALWWMMGSSVATHPDAIGYHLASSRGYSYNHDDYIENVLGMSYALGMDDWRERTYINYLRRGRKEVLDKIMERNEKEYAERRDRVLAERKFSFNEILIDRPWDKLNYQKGGTSNSSLLIFHQTWLDLLLKDGGQALEYYKKSKYQKGLEDFILSNLKAHVYKYEEYKETTIPWL